EVFVRRAGIAIGAAMLAAAIGIDADLKADVRAVVAGDDGAGDVAEELRVRRGALIRADVRVRLVMQGVEPVRCVLRRAASANGLVEFRHLPPPSTTAD